MNDDDVDGTTDGESEKTFLESNETVVAELNSEMADNDKSTFPKK